LWKGHEVVKNPLAELEIADQAGGRLLAQFVPLPGEFFRLVDDRYHTLQVAIQVSGLLRLFRPGPGRRVVRV